MTKKQKGDVAELAVAARCAAEGWSILFPHSDGCRYDLVLEKEGRFIRVQVKYVSARNGVLKVNCKSSNNWSFRSYTSLEIDCIAAYDPETQRTYFIPATEVNSSVFNIRLADPQNNQVYGIHRAEEYLKLTI